MIPQMRDIAGLPDLSAVVARRLTVLGSTGSVGVSTLDVVAHARSVYGEQAFPVEVLTAQANVDKLAEQALRIRPRLAVIGDESLHARLRDALTASGIETAAGAKAICEAAARPADIVMAAIVGAAGLAPALVAAKRGATIALANKECVVAAGEIFRDALASSGATVIPVDSEHNAIFQLIDPIYRDALEKVTVTASGGPFREWSRERMARATPEQAVAHPNWSMGAKISVDSATLMNKGLEVIEAHYLFSLPPEKLGIVVHPQSIVHCLVSYADGAILAHLSSPDMRTPISHALAWPRRIASPSRMLDLVCSKPLTFEAPDIGKFPCLALAQECLRAGGRATTILNAANEIAVQAFLGRRIGFLDIARVVEETLSADRQPNDPHESLDAVLEIDGRARAMAGDFCRKLAA
ncbi:MAG: 1-deoxy-D-xylulose-5-phosphate reductoisomerase [Rhizomicrobium sp.]